jgi:hypothetical protein
MSDPSLERLVGTIQTTNMVALDRAIRVIEVLPYNTFAHSAYVMKLSADRLVTALKDVSSVLP